MPRSGAPLGPRGVAIVCEAITTHSSQIAASVALTRIRTSRWLRWQKEQRSKSGDSPGSRSRSAKPVRRAPTSVSMSLWSSPLCSIHLRTSLTREGGSTASSLFVKEVSDLTGLELGSMMVAPLVWALAGSEGWGLMGSLNTASRQDPLNPCTHMVSVRYPESCNRSARCHRSIP